MKRILLIVAMLLVATPALAAVTITATDQGSGMVRVSYTADANVRAFALDINVGGSMTIDAISDFNVGDTNGYGIFPGKFRDVPINPVDPNWKDPNYNPVAPTSDPDANDTGLGGNYITVELGSLGANLGLIRSGTLFRLHCTGGGSMTIKANATRGGVVLEDGSSVAANLPVTITVNMCTVPTLTTCATANAAITGACGGSCLTVGNVTSECNNTVANGNVCRQTPAGGTSVACGTAVNYVCSTGPCCINIPAILGDTMTDANSAITTAGFTAPPAITYESNDTYAADLVCRQDTGCVAANATINYVVSTGGGCGTCPLDVSSPDGDFADGLVGLDDLYYVLNLINACDYQTCAVTESTVCLDVSSPDGDFADGLLGLDDLYYLLNVINGCDYQTCACP
jgi:hypothetical protein